jgi:hypothetical protein
MGLDILREAGSRDRPRMSPLRGGYCAATITLAATRVADDGLLGFGTLSILAVVNSLAQAASMGGR